MASPAGRANTNDHDPAPIAAEVVGLCGGDGQEDACTRFAAAIRTVIEFYEVGGSIRSYVLMWWNTLVDNRALARLEQAAAGKPMDKVDPKGPNFKSWLNITDDRADLMLTESDGENYELEVAVMASKFAYENMAYANNLVIRKLQGRDFEYFDCPNLSLGEFKTTQAMAFVRKEGESNVVYVAFRGSDETNDWKANLDCGHIKVSEDLGNVHVGFMKALGFIRSPDNSFDSRFPKELPVEQWENAPAYYAVRQWLMCEVERLGKEEKNTRIVVRVVGHSLGGALAILFVAMLRYHEIDIPAAVKSMEVITLGQPRVGDSTFAQYMTAKFIDIKPDDPLKITYKRMVYSYDPVPRVPASNDPYNYLYSRYLHFGTCLYYEGWLKKLRHTGESGAVRFPNVSLEYGIRAFNENVNEKEQAQEHKMLLQEPDSVVMSRESNMFLLQFHTVGEYLNAARHGKEGGRRSLLRRLLRSLLHPTSSFWNRSRRRVVITTDDDVVSSYKAK